jgi:hypothetical protein
MKKLGPEICVYETVYEYGKAPPITYSYTYSYTRISPARAILLALEIGTHDGCRRRENAFVERPAEAGTVNGEGFRSRRGRRG